MKEKQSLGDSTTNAAEEATEKEEEFGGPKGLEPTRYGAWERCGRVSDF